MVSKKAVYFSIDALIAVSLLFLSVFLSYYFIFNVQQPKQVVFVHSDLINTLSSLKVGEINNSFVRNLIDEGVIKDKNKSLIEQVGEFYVFNKTLAKGLVDSILSDLDLDVNIGFWFNENLISSVNNTPFENASFLVTSTQIISGLKEGESITAYSGRAFLKSNLLNDYFYFGGYVGEGNISSIISYNGTLRNVSFEGAVSRDFDVYVNGNYVGRYNKGESFLVPVKYNFPIGNFRPGDNVVEFVAENLSMAGGFIKITYEPEVRYNFSDFYRFPGISGLINLYDGVFVPSNLEEMEIYLKINSSKNFYLTLGNTSVYEGNTSGVQEIRLNNSYLRSVLNYSFISGKTLPIRLGLKNVSYVTGYYRDADVISVTDLSGSMNDCGIYSYPYMCNYKCFGGATKRCSVSSPSLCTGNPCGGLCFYPYNHYLDCNKTLISLAKDANKAFLNIVLSKSGNRAGLVGYRNNFSLSDWHNLSNNNSSLVSEIDSWVANGGTCICCGIQRAIQDLVNYSNPSKFRSMIVMSDGEANYACNGSTNINHAKSSAIQKACEAYQNYGIKVYAVGFGNEADEQTLQQIASCGNGSYYYSSVAELKDVYEQISQEVVEASYYEQRLVLEGGQVYTRLYPESNILFKHPSDGLFLGLISSVEKQFDSPSGVSFEVPLDSSLVDAKVVSYSGSYWTSDVLVNGVSVYNLSIYGDNYINLGDPYMINLPKSYFSRLNSINLSIGLSKNNKSSGSIYNKVIYTLSRNLSAFSKLYGAASGCSWRVEFSDGGFLQFKVPKDFSMDDKCYYNSSIGGGSITNNNDALQDSVLKLLQALDYNKDGKLDVIFNENSLEIVTSEISGIPYDWVTKIQVRAWR